MGVFRKINIFGGMKILWIFFGGHHKTGQVSAAISMNVWSVLKVNVQIGDIFGVAKISNIFGGMPDIPDILFAR